MTAPSKNAETVGERQDAPRGRDQPADGDRAALSWPERRFLAALGLPAFGLALSSTMVTTFLPKLLAELSGPAVTGLVIGSEGLFALFVPVLAGSSSDTVRTRFGGRIPFLLAAGPVMVGALVLMPLVGSVAAMAALVMVFFAGYFAYYAPYRALYPDLVPDRMRGRSQGAQKTLREAGLGAALVLGGVLLGIWRPLPFLVAALVMAAITAAFLLRSRALGRGDGGGAPSEGRSLADIVRGAAAIARDSRAIRRLLVANVFWEFTLAALKTFVVLYITVGLGRSMGVASAVLAIVAAAAVAGALIGGRLADRIGELALIRRALWIYAVGLLVPFFFDSMWVIAVVPIVALAAAVVMTLPYSLLMGLMPHERHGASAGVFELSRGLGTLLGPVTAGIAIELAEPLLASTKGYAAMFAVASAAIILSIPLTRRIPETAANRA